MNTRTGMAGWKKIKEHWSRELGLDLPDKQCWFCHLEMQRRPDRAHIKALAVGGANTANNLLLTCSHCNTFVDAVCMHSGEGGVLEWLTRCNQTGNAEIPPLPEVMEAVDKLSESMPREVALIIAHRAWVDRSRQQMEQELATSVAVKASLKASGKRPGPAPIGQASSAEGRSAEQRALLLIQEMRANGMSIRGIVARLNALGVPCRGEQWHATTIARLIRRQEAIL